MQYLHFCSSASSSWWPETGLQKTLTEHNPEWPEIFGDTRVLRGCAVEEAVAPKICRHEYHGIYLHVIAPWVFFPPFISPGMTEGGSAKPLGGKSEPFFGSSWKAYELRSQRFEVEFTVSEGNKFLSAGLWLFFISFVPFLQGLETLNLSVYLFPWR